MKRNCSSWSCFALAAIFVLSLTLAACDDDDPPAVNSLAFTGTGYTPHTGQTIRVAVVNSSTSAVVATDSVLVPADGTFSFAFTGVLARGVAYNLDYYADSNLGAGSGLDGNGVCDAPPLDHAWRVVIPAVGGNVTVAEVHNTSFTNVCASFPPTGFNLTFTGGGYTPHSGQTLRVAVVNSSTLAVVATDSVLLPADGTFSFTFTGFLMQGVAYNLDYYADSDAGAGSGIDGNGVCDAPGTDHAWRVAIPAPTAAVVQAETHNTTFTNVCASFNPKFDLTFTGGGYTPHTGQTIRVAVVNGSTAEVVATNSVVVPADGTFSFNFTGILAQNVPYNLDYYADSDAGAGSGIDGNGVCDAPATDHAWRVAIPAPTAAVTQAETHNTTFTNVCASFP